MQVGNFNIHLSSKKGGAAKSAGAAKPDYLQNLKEAFSRATGKLEESKKVPGAFVMNTFQVNHPQFLNIKDISSQVNGSSPV
jgi:hypothetical protein